MTLKLNMTSKNLQQLLLYYKYHHHTFAESEAIKKFKKIFLQFLSNFLVSRKFCC